MKTRLLTCIALITAITINAQVTLVKEINDSGTSNSSPTDLFVFNNKIYFQADDSSGSNTPGGADLGDELWITDGTEMGTQLLKDIRLGAGHSSPAKFFVLNGVLYFTAFDTASELWKTDGTEVGTTLVDIMPSITGESPQRHIEFGGLSYFTVGAQPGTGSETTNKLVQWDGTDPSISPAVQVSDVGAGYESILSDIVAFDNRLFFYMNYSTDDSTTGNELYAYDPTTDAFTLIKDIDAGPADSSISNFTVIGSELYFEADNALWKTDGTEVGTVAVTAASSITFLANFYAWNGELYFEGDDGTGDQLWKYDPVGDLLTKLSALAGDADHNPSDYAIYDGYLYYSGADANDTDKHLFRTNGTTVEQLDSSIKDVDEIVVLNGVLYFEADNYTTGNELYKFDPLTLSTDDNRAEIVKVYPNPASDYIMVSKSLIDASYSIYDITGKTVKESTITSEKVDLDLSSGLYLFKVKTDQSILTKKKK
jgi:ELWxxDGT repeat protein